MNIEESLLLNLIKQSQFGPSDTIDFKGVNMDLLYDEAVNQAVIGLIAPELPVALLNKKWIQALYKQKSAYILYCHEQDNLKSLLDEEKIPFVILKGNASAISYTNPADRSMGDIDFLVPQDMYEQTRKALTAAGYVEAHNNGRHASFRKNSFVFELHHHYSHEINIEGFLINGLNNREFASVDGHSFPMLPKLENGLVLLDHFSRHLKTAIGLRQLVDWMMYVYRNLNDDFWYSCFQPIAREKGLEKIAICITRCCQIYLGLPKTITWANSADEKTCEQLLRVIFMSGNFGIKNGSGNRVETFSLAIKKEGFFSWLQRVGEINWDAYHKFHVLKPLCWLYQLIRIIRRHKFSSRSINQLRGDVFRCNERYELLDKLYEDY